MATKLDLESPFLSDELFADELESTVDTRAERAAAQSPFVSGLDLDDLPVQNLFGDAEDFTTADYAHDDEAELDDEVLWDEIADSLPPRIVRPLIADETPPLSKGVARFEHWFQPMKPDPTTASWVADGKERKLEPLDPGFFDASGKLKPSALNDALKELLKKPAFRGHLSKMQVALVDLTGAKLLEPEFAGWGSTVPVVGASCPKIAPLYAAFQLRNDLKHVAAAEKITTNAELIRVMEQRWKNAGIQGPPKLKELLYAYTNPPALEFTAAIDHAINNIIDHDAANQAARVLIEIIGFPYIASLLWHSGLRHPTRGGLWLTSNYNGGARWSKPIKPAPAPVFGHNATALSLVTFFTLLGQNRLAPSGLPRTIKTALSTASWFTDVLPSASIASKVGLLKRCLEFGPKLKDGRPVLGRDNKPKLECKRSIATHVHEAGLIENGGFRYAVAILTTGIPTGVTVLQKLIGELDGLIRKNNPTVAGEAVENLLESHEWMQPEQDESPAAQRSALRIPEAVGEDEAEVESECAQDFEDDELFEHEDPATQIEAALKRQDWSGALQTAIRTGERDDSKLTNLLFFARHPELDPTRKLAPQTHPADKKLAQEWSKIRDREVWAAIEKSAKNTALAVSGKEVASEHRIFWGPGGKQFKQLVAWAAQEVDLDPGLLATALIAEAGGIASYLTKSKVSSYHIGVDDFYAMRGILAQHVPAYSKIGWDRKQTPQVHPNDAQKNPRDVQTIWFNSGRDGLLATAVYLKYAQVRLRDDAKTMGGDFDTLPIETRFALIRISMAAGRAGAATRLKQALKGEDILVRNYKPAKAYQTNRNATIRAAQALHLSDWIFGIRAATTAVQPEIDERWEDAGAFEVELADELNVAAEFEDTDEAEDESDASAQFEEFEEEVIDADELEDSLFDTSPEVAEAPFAFQHDQPAVTVRQVAIGERIELDLNTAGFAGNIDHVRWSIPGRVVRSYDGGVRTAKVFELDADALRRPKITFFWVDASDNRKVEATIRTKSGASETFVAIFDVKAPKVTVFTGTAGVTQLEKRARLLGMRFGKLGVAPGVKWNWKIQMPTGHAGYIKDVQTLLQDRTKEQALAPDKRETRKLRYRHPSRTEAHLQLDGQDNGQAAYSAGLGDAKVEAGDWSLNIGAGSSDSPFTDLSGLDRLVSVNDRFTYFLMFKPHTAKAQDAIWVPIAKASWFWEAVARVDGKKWVLRKAKMKPVIKKKTSDFPLYESNAAENEWHVESQ